MTTLAREFDACGECRLEIGGPRKHRTLSTKEIISVVSALEQSDEKEMSRLRDSERRLGLVMQWLAANQEDVFRRGLWDAIKE